MHMIPCGLMSFVLLLNSFRFCFTVGVVGSDLIAGQSFVFMIRFLQYFGGGILHASSLYFFPENG